jgi:hypothetical protein
MSVSGRIISSVLTTLVIVGLSHSAFAAGNAGNREIRKLTHADNSRLSIIATKNWLNPDSCNKSNQVILAAGLLVSEKVYREMYALVLSAHVSGRRVEVRTNGCIGIAGTTYPVITQVTLL